MEQLCEPNRTFLSHLAAVQHCLDTRDTRMCGSPQRDLHACARFYAVSHSRREPAEYAVEVAPRVADETPFKTELHGKRYLAAGQGRGRQVQCRHSAHSATPPWH